MKEFKTTRLSNGLKIIYESSITDVLYCGYVINAGTRDESINEEGMAHFCEHMSFKGTSRRKAWHISNALECVGGDLNAYTSKEETVYYAALPKEEMGRAIDILTDMVFHSTYPQKEIDHEVEVIADEIESYNDSPSELIFDEFEEMIFNKHPLGRNILGNSAKLRTFTTEKAKSFTQRFYRTTNATFFIYGNVNFDRAILLLERATNNLTSTATDKGAVPMLEYKPSERICKKDTHQAHVIIGTRGVSANDNKRTGLFLLNNILGGPAMNSRLNLSLREKRGLVYTVESYMITYTDAGIWGIYFGCDAKNIERCKALIIKELNKLIDEPLTSARLASAKRQIKGQIRISCDNFENYALAMGKIYSQYDRHRDIEDQIRRIDELTADKLQAIAREIFSQENLTTLIYK